MTLVSSFGPVGNHNQRLPGAGMGRTGSGLNLPRVLLPHVFQCSVFTRCPGLFYVNTMQARVNLEEDISIERVFPLDWPVGQFVVYHLN